MKYNQMKSPEAIKKGLEICSTVNSNCDFCPYVPLGNYSCFDILKADALAYIQQLETKCHQLERERDELVEIIRNEANFNPVPLQCRCCKNFNGDFTKDTCRFCGTQASFGNFEWRGAKEDNQ